MAGTSLLNQQNMKEQHLPLNCMFSQTTLSPSARISGMLLVLLPIFLLAGCTGTSGEKDASTPPPLYPQPQTVELKEGVPIPATPKIIHPDSVAKPQSFAVDHAALTTINAYPNRRQIPADLTTIPVDRSQLRTIPLGEGNPDFVLLSSTGDTIPTGVPVPAMGRVVQALHSRPTKALPPSTKDAAIAHLQYLDVEHGMVSTFVWSMLEDQSGNIWFGGFGGVSVFNGESFTRYTEKEGLSLNDVRSMLEDQSGNIWLGTAGGGLSVFNGEHFTQYTVNEGLSSNFVGAIAEDKHGNIWLGTSRGVSVFNGESFTHYTVNEGLSSNSVRAIAEDQSGNIWLGTWGGGVSVFNGESFTHYTVNEGLSSNLVGVIAEDKHGNIWLGTSGGGVSVFNGESFTQYTVKEGLSNNEVWSITEDQSGNIWVGTRGGGVSVFNGESFTHYTVNEGLSNNNVLSILEDQSGQIWLGTDGGANLFNEDSFSHYSQNEGLSHNDVWSIAEDQSGNIWVGTWGGGVNVFNGESFTHYTEKEGLANNNVWSILEDNSGNIWLGTFGGGVSVYNGESFTHYGVNEGLSNNTAWSILEDNSGNIWLGTDGGGVSVYNGEHFTHYTVNEGLSNNFVWSILEDKNGNIWLGTQGGGVSVFNGESFTHYTENEGLSNNFVFSIAEDQSGNIWLGTFSGVSVFNGESFTHFSENEGLANNNVWSILEDKRAPLHETRVFVATGNGLSRISLTEDATSGVTEFAFSIQNFGKQDGLKGLGFNPKSAIIDSKNRAWWGTGSGLVMQDLNTLTFSDKIPQPRLTQLDINEQFIDYRTILDSSKSDWDHIRFTGVQNFENYPLDLQLPYDNNHLTFHFVAIDWAAPHKIRYSYRMEGLNTNWSQPTANPVADYRNLPFGTYTLQIRAIGESGVWSEPFEYTFTILPPWWHTWWAYGFYLMLFIVAIVGFIQWRTHKLRSEKEELEQKVSTRTSELNESLENLKATQSQLVQQEKLASLGQLTAGIAHEIKNPLNFVNNFSDLSMELIQEAMEELKNYPSESEEIDDILIDVVSNLRKIYEHGTRADSIVKSMLEHSRGGDGKMEPTPLNPLVKEYVNLAFHGMRASKEPINVDIDLQLDESVGEVPLIAEDFSRVILNLCNNSFDAMRSKLTEQGDDSSLSYHPKLTIRTKSENGQILIEIEDNGPGIPNDIKDKILQPFFTTKKGTQGTGLGLSITNDIIKAHGGKIEITSTPGEGSTFIIELPT